MTDKPYDYPSTAFKLTNPSEKLIYRLATDPAVDAHEVRSALGDISGLTFQEAMTYIDIVRSRQNWSIDTLLAVMEGLDSVRLLTN